MYLIVIAWLYVVLMMAVAEGFSSQGSLLGALITFLLYGVLPLGLVIYIMNTPHRKARLKAKEDALASAKTPSAIEPDTARHAAGAAQDTAVPAVGKEP